MIRATGYRVAKRRVTYRRGLRKLQKEEQQNVALHCKQNPKAFWKYINSKRKTKTGIGDLHVVDISGNSTTVTSNKDKAEELTQLNSTEKYGRRCLTPLSPHRNYILS